MADSEIARKLAELRDEFDATFAAPVRPVSDVVEKFLTVRSGGAGYAFRLAETSGIAVDRRATPVPGPLPELTGITSVRGRLVPVYSLSALLGAPPPAAARWLVLAEREQLAFAVEHLDGCVSARREDVLRSSGNADGHCPETLRLHASSLGILSVPSLVKRITARVALTRPQEQ